MSRGLGKIEKFLFATILRHGKPMTFGDIRAEIRQRLGVQANAKFRASFERSARRALHRLTGNLFLIAMGDGGPGEPFRYFLHPLGIRMMADTPEARALWEAFEADPGANEAMVKSMEKIPPPDFLPAVPASRR
jgi:hypothetical protein